MGNEKKLNKRAEDLAKVLWYYNMVPDSNGSACKIVCPFHKDANPSLLIDLESGSWHCFGCGKSGDAVKFVQLMEKGLNDLQALRRLQEILRSKECSNFAVKSFRRKRKRPQRELYAQAYDYYHGLSKVNWWRDTGDEASQAREYMGRRGFSPGTLCKAGAKVTYNSNYGLVFPMMDNGKFKGWVCRTMVKEVEQKRKYLYNEGFSRATTLVGSYGSNRFVFVVEGYMDRLKFVQFGYENVVAILGWKMSAEQIEKLKNLGVDIVVSALDNDECGRKGTKFLRQHFRVVRFCYLKGIKDPGEMTEETFKRMFDKTMKKLKALGGL